MKSITRVGSKHIDYFMTALEVSGYQVRKQSLGKDNEEWIIWSDSDDWKEARAFIEGLTYAIINRKDSPQ